MELFFLIWIASMVGCAMVASSKNRSVAGWLVLGFLFGFIALLVIALIDPEPGTRTAQSTPLILDKETGLLVTPADTKACPFCAELIKAEAIKCKHCGSDLLKLA